MTVVLLAVAAGLAVVDWIAVQLRLFRVERLAKPATLALLVAAAAVADLAAPKVWVVAALAFGLAGDVGLLLSRDDGPPDAPFLAGLGAFLVGHACWIVAFARYGPSGLDVLAGALIVGGIAGLWLPDVLRGAAGSAGTAFAWVVLGYATALAAMAVLAVGTAVVATAVGGILFVASDTMLARERFATPVPYSRLLVIVTYHLAQGLMLFGLIRSF